ncbi:MAG: family 1 encapsulin nanocompartment shell protein [Halanaerobiaceae bacterium]
MVDILNRSLAPIPDEAWEFLDEEAKDILELRLGARKVVEFEGPLGLDVSSINTGRMNKISAEGAEFRSRETLNLIEVELPVKIDRTEIDAFVRGAEDADSDPVREAAKKMAEIENKAIFFGMPEAGIEGIIPLSKEEYDPIKIEEDRSSFFSAIFTAREKLLEAGIEDSYKIIMGPKHYNLLNKLETSGYPFFKKIEDLVGSEIIYVPELGDNSVMLAAGDDFELFVGQDVSLGFKDYDADSVDLFLFETFTFKVNGPEAAITFE